MKALTLCGVNTHEIKADRHQTAPPLYLSERGGVSYVIAFLSRFFAYVLKSNFDAFYFQIPCPQQLPWYYGAGWEWPLNGNAVS